MLPMYAQCPHLIKQAGFRDIINAFHTAGKTGWLKGTADNAENLANTWTKNVRGPGGVVQAEHSIQDLRAMNPKDLSFSQGQRLKNDTRAFDARSQLSTLDPIHQTNMNQAFGSNPGWFGQKGRNLFEATARTVYDTPRALTFSPASSTGYKGFIGAGVVSGLTGVPNPYDYMVDNLASKTYYGASGNMTRDAQQYAQAGAYQGAGDMLNQYTSAPFKDRWAMAMDPSKTGIQGNQFAQHPNTQTSPWHEAWNTFRNAGVTDDQIRQRVAQGVDQQVKPYMNKAASEVSEEPWYDPTTSSLPVLFSAVGATIPHTLFNKCLQQDSKRFPLTGKQVVGSGLFSHNEPVHGQGIEDIIAQVNKDRGRTGNATINLNRDTYLPPGFNPSTNILQTDNESLNTLFHELGHATTPHTTPNFLAATRGAMKGVNALAPLGMMLSNNINDQDTRQKTDMGLATAGALASAPTILDELYASHKGLQLAKSMGQSLKEPGALNALKTFKGVPSYLLAGATLPMIYGLNKLQGVYDKKLPNTTGLLNKTAGANWNAVTSALSKVTKPISNTWKTTNPLLRRGVGLTAAIGTPAALSYYGTYKPMVENTKAVAYDQGYNSAQYNAQQYYQNMPTWQRAIAAVAPQTAINYGMSQFNKQPSPSPGGMMADMNGPVTSMYTRPDGVDVY